MWVDSLASQKVSVAEPGCTLLPVVVYYLGIDVSDFACVCCGESRTSQHLPTGCCFELSRKLLEYF